MSAPFDHERFPLLVGSFRFTAYYQRGNLDLETSTWTVKENGPHHLVVCECGRAAYSPYLDDAVHTLQRSYVMEPNGAHYHQEEKTFPCNIIEAVQNGSEPWVMGTVLMPDLLKDLPADSETRIKENE